MRKIFLLYIQIQLLNCRLCQERLLKVLHADARAGRGHIDPRAKKFGIGA